MGEGKEVRSPWSSSPNDPRRGESPGSRSSPSCAPREDSHFGKGLRRDNLGPMPVLGGGGSAELEKAMDRGMRNDSRR
jgi:hypothetical protein